MCKIVFHACLEALHTRGTSTRRWRASVGTPSLDARAFRLASRHFLSRSDFRSPREADLAPTRAIINTPISRTHRAVHLSLPLFHGLILIWLALFFISRFFRCVSVTYATSFFRWRAHAYTRSGSLHASEGIAEQWIEFRELLGSDVSLQRIIWDRLYNCVLINIFHALKFRNWNWRLTNTVSSWNFNTLRTGNATLRSRGHDPGNANV